MVISSQQIRQVVINIVYEMFNVCARCIWSFSSWHIKVECVSRTRSDHCKWDFFQSFQIQEEVRVKISTSLMGWFGPIHSSNSFIWGSFICETFLVINSTACWAPVSQVLFWVREKIKLNWPLNWYLIFARLQHGHSRSSYPVVFYHFEMP